ncbi:type II toxin-antitoxin system VapC family toxin [Thermomonas fusca]|uniref:type II toxin-antitoxin system VapC family toxin n=1 Tax=Thermomonas fusca TaxID=215690 RepID=UPI00048E7408|nr:type II toxin-antitoxin system VapC family toxin [Thermomonas fusca]
MSGKATVVYWDSSAFIALLKEERTHGDGVYDALLSQAGAFDRNQIVLATSTIGIAEVLSMPLADGARERFESMIQRSNFQTIAVSDGVARQAARLRNHCYGREKNGAGEPYILTTPDAIHVVSAMLIKADVLVTLDSENKSVKVERREMAMTKVASHYPVPDLHPVAISRPGLGLPGTGLL